jgi:NAD-dependent dihydropyrimidine dehydrogenase PreA subunit
MQSIKYDNGKLSRNARKVSLEERRRFLGLSLKITGVLAGGSMLSLVPVTSARSELLGASVVGTYTYQPHYAMLIYNDRCIDCERCIQACEQTNNVPSYGYRITILGRKKTGIAASKMIREFLPVLCNQCNRPPCVRVCPTRATFKDKKNGIVMMKESLCIGCKACIVTITGLQSQWTSVIFVFAGVCRMVKLIRPALRHVLQRHCFLAIYQTRKVKFIICSINRTRIYWF